MADQGIVYWSFTKIRIFMQVWYDRQLWEVPTQKMKSHISNSGQQWSGFIRELEENVSDTCRDNRRCTVKGLLWQWGSLWPALSTPHVPLTRAGRYAAKATLLKCPMCSSKNLNYELGYLLRGAETPKTAFPLQRAPVCSASSLKALFRHL